MLTYRIFNYPSIRRYCHHKWELGYYASFGPGPKIQRYGSTARYVDRNRDSWNSARAVAANFRVTASARRRQCSGTRKRNRRNRQS
jgi:hypothetical protein